MSNTTRMRHAWHPPCQLRAVRYTLHGGATVTVDARIVEALAALDFHLARHGYSARPGVTGAYNCRRITGGSGYSLHSYGIAIDINWDTNPYSPSRINRLATDMPRALVDDVLAIRTREGKPVWVWGGDWRTIKDPMHFEPQRSPSELAVGIVPQAAPTPDPPRPRETATAQRVALGVI